MRRLYSTFAGGWPGIGLLLTRLVVGCGLIVATSSSLLSTPSMLAKTMSVLLAGCGALLIPGLWTPIAGTLIALIEICQLVTQPGDRWGHLLLGTIGGALAMLGPGLWSVDGRLFGWKRVEAPCRKQ